MVVGLIIKGTLVGTLVTVLHRVQLYLFLFPQSQLMSMSWFSEARIIEYLPHSWPLIDIGGIYKETNE